jgi:hypothetical protein
MSAVATPHRSAAQQLFGDAPVKEAAARALLLPPELRPTVPDGGRLTLEQVLSSAWEGLLTAGEADCPVCRGRLSRHGPTGTCGSCGTSVS